MDFGMWCSGVLNYVKAESIQLLFRAKCGDSYLSIIPTLLWTIGATALAHRLVSAMFRRFMFRRVPLWEVVIQHLLFIWMLIYSLYFWGIVVNVVKFFIEYCYRPEEGSTLTIEDIESCKLMQQWVIWMCAIAPLAFYVQTRPKPVAPPLMIWITASPWQRREMGAYGYYLNRPFSSLEPSANVSIRLQALTLRRAFSDSKTIIKEPPRKRRNSKSI